MGILMFTARIHFLIHRKLDVEYKLTKLTRKLQDLQSYAALVGAGGIAISDLLSSPGSTMGRAMNYLAYSHNSSLQYMQQQAPYMTQFYMNQMGQGQSPEQQQQMKEWILRSLYEQGRDRAMQVETRNLKIEEQKIAQEKDKLEALGKSLAAELESAKQARDQGIKDMAPKYTFNA